MSQQTTASPSDQEKNTVAQKKERMKRITTAISQKSPPWLISFIVHQLLFILLATIYMTAAKMPRDTANLSVDMQPGGSAPFPEFRIGKGSPWGNSTVSSLSSSNGDSSALKPASPMLDTIVAGMTPTDPNDAGLKNILSGSHNGPKNEALGEENASGESKLGGGKAGKGIGTGIGDGIGSGQGKGQTSLFGAKGEGNRFIYVLDRSGSMSENNMLQFAKTELMASIQKLKATNEIQVIFYNAEPFIFNPGKGPDRFVTATRENKIRLQHFLDSIYPFDGTDHQKALLRAIRMRPDVIFLFTDANEPKLGPLELDYLHLEADGIVINTIEVGHGSEPVDNNNFLVLLARQNKGQHVYIDINTIPPQ